MPSIDTDDIVPGSLQMIVEEVSSAKRMEGQRPTKIAAHDPAIGLPLQIWLQKFGGSYTGQIPDPTGQPYTVSLEAWKGCDPATTFIRVYFKFQQKSLLGTRVNPPP